MASAHYRQPWVLLNHPEFRMSPGNPNFKPSPYPTFVMYKHRTPPRSFAPANTELAAPPGMKSVPRYGYTGEFAQDDDGGEVFQHHSHGTAAPGAQVHTPPPPRVHGVSGSTPGYTATGVPPRASAQTVIGGSSTPPQRTTRQSTKRARNPDAINMPNTKLSRTDDRMDMP